MGIGTSLGAFFESSFDHQAGTPYVPDVKQPPDTGDDNVLPPDDSKRNVIEAKDRMPFPDNNNPDTDFNNRFGKLPPSGILNDLKKPTGETIPLVRRISMTTDDRGAIQDNGGEIAEMIKSPALHIEGKLYEAPNHGMALNNYLDSNPTRPTNGLDAMREGFTTTSGRFVDREEALAIAKKQDQIKPEVLPALTSYSSMLLSEDLKGFDGKTAEEKLINMRRAANDNHVNKPGDPPFPWLDEKDALDAHYKKMADDMHKAGSKLDIIEGIKRNPNLSEFEQAKINKLSKEYESLSPAGYTVDEALKKRTEFREKQEESFRQYYDKYKTQTAEERGINRARILESLNPGVKVEPEKLYQEMADLLAIKNPSGFERDRIKHLNGILDKLEDLD